MARFQQEVSYLHEVQSRYVPKLFLQSDESSDEFSRLRKEKLDAEVKLKKITKVTIC